MRKPKAIRSEQLRAEVGEAFTCSESGKKYPWVIELSSEALLTPAKARKLADWLLDAADYVEGKNARPRK
jgi:hypothetical protein